MSTTISRYAGRGVSSSKEDVHAAIRHIDKGLYPKAFCKIIPDTLSGNPEACLVMHADGAGTSRRSPTPTGARRATHRYGKASLRTRS